MSAGVLTSRVQNTQPRPQRIFSLQEEGKKEALEHFRHVIKICPNRGHIFKNKLRNTWAAILKTPAVSGYKFTRLVCRAKDKNKNENIRAKSDISVSLILART